MISSNKKENWPSYSKKEAEIIQRVLQSNKVNYWTGEECRKFENEFASFSKTKYAVALSNGTIAIELALKAIGLKRGDEVIVTSRTFIASASSIVNMGGKPIFADVCLNSQNILSSEILKKITTKTKAIICVHLAGWPCEMDRIMNIARKKKLFVIEDCAQAHGAMYKGKPVGSIGDIGCWSFCQDKIISTGGEGGMITTNSKKIWSYIWSYKDHGKSYAAVHKKYEKTGFKWVHNSFGSNFRMIEIQAALGRYQLKQLPKWTRIRNKYQNKIWKTARKFKSLRVPEFNLKTWSGYHNGHTHAAYKCYVFVTKEFLNKGWNRDKIMNEINRHGVPCFSGSCSEVYLEKAFKDTKFNPKKRLHNAKKLGEDSLLFLIHPTLKLGTIDKACKVIEKVMISATKGK